MQYPLQYRIVPITGTIHLPPVVPIYGTLKHPVQYRTVPIVGTVRPLTVVPISGTL